MIRSRTTTELPVGSRVELGEVKESVPLEPPPPGEPEGRRRVLERITVPVGLELRALQNLARQVGVEAESLNYLGTRTNKAFLKQGSSKTLSWIKLESDGTSSVSATIPISSPTVPLLVALDVDDAHCIEVLRTAHAACQVYSAAEKITFTGLSNDIRADVFGLYQYLALASKLIELNRCPDAVVMSVDFGIACLEANAVGGTNPLEGQASLACYSFPIFETALGIILKACANNSASAQTLTGKAVFPVIFAAAGNRDSTIGIRQRLAYPALRPDIIAVTHITGDVDTGYVTPSQSSDLTLSYDFKPIFGVEEKFASDAGAPVTGTSFAAPWCATWYIALKSLGEHDAIAQNMVTPLARMARLQQLCEAKTAVATVAHLDRSTPVALIPRVANGVCPTPSLASNAVRRTSDMLRSLNNEFKLWEFAITGSAAALIAVFPDAFPCSSESPSDIDMIFSGEAPLSDATREAIKTKVAGDISLIFDGPHLPVEITSAAGRVAPFALFQCIIPAASIYVTAAGMLDVWGGVKDITDGRIRILEPSHDLNLRNPLAMFEQHALLPSLLVALCITARLQCSCLVYRQGEFPDVSESWERRLLRAIEQDDPSTWGTSIIDRLEKLLCLMTDVMELAGSSGRGMKAPNLCGAVRVLREAIQNANLGPGSQLSRLISFGSHAKMYESRFSKF